MRSQWWSHDHSACTMTERKQRHEVAERLPAAPHQEGRVMSTINSGPLTEGLHLQECTHGLRPHPAGS